MSRGRPIRATWGYILFAAAAAAWVLSEVGRWDYLLVTSMIDTMGPRWVYDRLMRVFEKVGLPDGITPLDIHLASPDELRIQALPIHVENACAGVDLHDKTCNGFHFPGMVIYRFLPTTLQAKDPSRRFDAGVKQLLAA